MKTHRSTLRSPRPLLVTLALTLGAAACVHGRAPVTLAAASPAATIPPPIDARSLAVYRTVTDSVYVRTTQRTVAVESAPLDTACVGCAPIAERWAIASLKWNGADAQEMSSVRNDWVARNGRALDLSVVPNGWPNLVSIRPSDVPSSESDLQDWSAFRDSNGYAVGAVRFSSVGFGRSGRTALVTVEWRCGPTCGHSLSAALVATSDTTWRIDDMVLVSSLQHQE